MNAQRSLSFALVVVQAAALAYCFRTTVFSAVVVGIALIGWLSNFRLASPDGAKRWALGLVVLYVVQRTIVPPAWYSGASAFFFRDSPLIAEYFLIFQVAQFFVRREGNRLPSYLPILAIMVLTFAGDFRAANDQARVVFQGFSVGLVALCAGYFAACRLPGAGQPARRFADRLVFQAIVLLASGALGWAAASNLFRYSQQIEMLIGAAMTPDSPPESAGFSGKGRLGSVAQQKAGAGSRVALRIYADDSLGYLRGRAMDTYDRAQWRTDDQWTTLTPTTGGDSRPSAVPGQDDFRTFWVTGTATDSRRRLEIWPNQAFEKVVLVPPGLAALEIPVDHLSINKHGIIEADELPSDSPYVALTLKDASRLHGETGTGDEPAATASRYAASIPATDWELLTAVPDDMDPRIRELADRVAGKASTAGEKIAAVEGYLLDNYEYQFGIDIPAGVDPVAYFLLEKPPAHCEFFASGAALLLRAVGVPTRYVTGFVAAERNDYGNYWVVRNRDAHAWAEAFDPERGWVVVEATPASGVPQPASAPAASQFWDALRAQWQRLVVSVRRDGIRAVLSVLWRWFVRPWFAVLLLLIAAAFALRRIRRWRRARPARPIDPRLAQLQRLLAQMDQRWRKAGLPRPPHETLHQFAQRIICATPAPAGCEAAEWYRQLAAIRFSGRLDAASVQTLEEAFARIARGILLPPNRANREISTAREEDVC